MYRDVSNIPVDAINEDVAKAILNLFKEKFSTDFSNMPLLLFRRRLAVAFKQKEISAEKILLDTELLSTENFDQLLYYFYPDHTEIFRDAETWIFLRDKILNNFSGKDTLNVFFPFVCTGEEVYSFIILMNEFYPEKDFRIVISSMSEWALNRILKGYFVKPKSRVSYSNFKSVCEKGELAEYHEKANNAICFKRAYLKNIEQKLNENQAENKEKFDLVFCRNKTLSFNKEGATRLINTVLDSVNKRGMVLFGISEFIPESVFENFQIISKSEKIFQRNVYGK